jgi:hypothetical protein
VTLLVLSDLADEQIRSNNRTMQFLKYFFTLIIDVNNYVVEMTHTLAGYLCIHG